MASRIPKDPALRQRRNKETRTALNTESEKRRVAPYLPKHKDWHPMTRAWWKDVWHSPMSDQYLDADRHGLYRLAELVDAFWLEPSANLAAEIRLQQMSFGLTPLDRLRLRWEVKRVEEATKQRQRVGTPTMPVDDPRNLLKVVS